jgi:hypothetical protein
MMTDEQRLIEKLQRIEALFAGAATPGEREAAAQARNRTGFVCASSNRLIRRSSTPSNFTIAGHTS